MINKDIIKDLEAVIKGKCIFAYIDKKSAAELLKVVKKYHKIIKLNDEAAEKNYDAYKVIEKIIQIVDEDLN